MTDISTSNDRIGATLPFVRGLAIQPSLQFRKSVPLAVENQCTHVYVEGSVGEDRAQNWDDRHFEEAEALFAESGIRPIFHGNYKNPLAHEIEEVRAAAEAFTCREVDVAARLNAPLIVHGSFIVAHRQVRETRLAARDAFSRSAANIVRYAADKGVEVWLENLENYRDKHPFQAIYSAPDDYEMVLERVPGARFILDVGHEHISSGAPADTFRRFADRIAAVDVNDNAGEVDTHWALGKGHVDFEALVRAMVDSGWSGYLSFETRGAPVPQGVQYLGEIHKRVIDSAA